MQSGRAAGQAHPARLGVRTDDAELDVQRRSVRQAPAQVVGEPGAVIRVDRLGHRAGGGLGLAILYDGGFPAQEMGRAR